MQAALALLFLNFSPKIFSLWQFLINMVFSQNSDVYIDSIPFYIWYLISLQIMARTMVYCMTSTRYMFLINTV